MGKKYLSFFASRHLALGLFLTLALILAPATFLAPPPAFLPHAVRGTLALLGLNLLACTLRHWHHLSWPTRLFHAGSFLVLLGGLASSRGSLATVNIHERGSTSSVTRWDPQREIPLDYELHLDAIGRAYYPMPIKLGILRAGEKVGLLTGNTGQDLFFDHFRIVASDFDRAQQSVRLAVYEKESGILLGHARSGGSAQELSLPLQFQLVAYQEAPLQRLWVELRLTREGRLLASGRAEANQPFLWNGERFFLTATEEDRYGLPYAGLQIVRDPAVPIVYGGFSLLLLAALAQLLAQSGRGKRVAPDPAGQPRAAKPFRSPAP